MRAQAAKGQLQHHHDDDEEEDDDEVRAFRATTDATRGKREEQPADPPFSIIIIICLSCPRFSVILITIFT
jgi:hypothetical protein